MLSAVQRQRASVQDNQPLTYKEIPYDDYKAKIKVGNRKKDAVAWRTSHGTNVEGLCRVMHNFADTINSWNLANSPARKFEVFKQYLGDRPLSVWTRIADREVSINNGIHTHQGFINSVEQFVESFTGPRPRNKCTAYLMDSRNIMKPRDSTVHEHADRIEQLFFMHDLLPGNTEKLNDEPKDPNLLALQVEKRKNILFRSFPTSWQHEFTRVRGEHDSPDVSWHDILSYMSNHQTMVNQRVVANQARANRNQRGNRAGRGHGSRQSYGGRGRSNFRLSHQFRPYQDFRNHRGNYQGFQGYQRPYQPNFRGGYGNNRFNRSPRPGPGRFPSNNRSSAPARGNFPPNRSNHQNNHYMVEQQQNDSFLFDAGAQQAQMMPAQVNDAMNAQESYYNVQNLNENNDNENQGFNNEQMGPHAHEEQAQEEQFQYENYDYENDEAFQFDDSFYEQGDY